MAKSPVKKPSVVIADKSGRLYYEHRGFGITFDPQKAEFFADNNGTRVSKPSLDALKKELDKFVRFDSFEAFAGFWGSPTLEVVTVVGVKHRNNTRLRRMRTSFLVKSSGKRASGHPFEASGPVFEKSEKNRRLIQAMLELEKERDRIEEQYNKRIDAIRKRIKEILPDDAKSATAAPAGKSAQQKKGE